MRALLLAALLLCPPIAEAGQFGAWIWGGVTTTSTGGTASSTSWISLTGNRLYLIGTLEDDTDLTVGEANLSIWHGQARNAFINADYAKIDTSGGFVFMETDALTGTASAYKARSIILSNWTSGGINADGADRVFNDGTENCQVFLRGDAQISYVDASAARACSFFYYYKE